MICVDATVAGKWLFPEEFSQEALALVEEAVRAGESLVGPHLLPVEVTNIVRQRMRLEALPLDQARQLLARFLAFHVKLRSPASLNDLALQLAATFDLPAAYDAHYVALAQQLRCVLWTDDRRLLRILGGRLPFVHWIGNYQPGHRT